MASIIWSDVTAHAPELASIAAGAQTNILAMVNARLVVSEFDGESGPLTKLARVYLAAHFGTVTAQGGAGAAGPVIGESAGGLSRQYASAGTDPLFDTTTYGKAFRALCAMAPARAPRVL